MTQTATDALAPEVFDEAYRRVAPLVHRTPLLHSTSLSQETGYDVWLKAEIFQRTGSYKVRGPSNKLPQLSREEPEAGVTNVRPTAANVTGAPSWCGSRRSGW